MRNLIIFGLLVILLVAAQFTSAKSVDDVIAKYVRARGGMDRLLSIKSVQLQGTREFMGREEPIKIIKKLEEDGQVFSAGEATGELFLQAAEGEPESFHQPVPLPAETDLAGPLVDYPAKGHRAELLGKELQDGHNCYKIKLTTGAGGTVLYWIDTDTYLLNRCLTIYDTHHFIGEILIIYSNYQIVNGIPFAYTREIKITGQGGESQKEVNHFHSIVLNPVANSSAYNA